MKDNLERVAHPFKLTIETQDKKWKEICNSIIFNNLSKTATLKKLKAHNCTSEAKNINIENAIARKEELGEINIQESEYKYPSFAIR